MKPKAKIHSRATVTLYSGETIMSKQELELIVTKDRAAPFSFIAGQSVTVPEVTNFQIEMRPFTRVVNINKQLPDNSWVSSGDMSAPYVSDIDSLLPEFALTFTPEGPVMKGSEVFSGMLITRATIVIKGSEKKRK